MRNVVAYCRVSTDKEDQLNSLEKQKEYFTEFAKKNGYNLLKIYADEGKSGTRMKKRKELQQLLEDAKRGEFKAVLVKDVSRLARNTVDFLTILRELRSYGVRTVFAAYNPDTKDLESKELDELMLTMLAAVAQEESKNMSSRVKMGKRINAERGRVPNLVYGYDKIPGNYFELNINDSEKQIVKDIFHMYTVDGYGANKIAITLNKRGEKTKRGCKWSQNAVSRILSNYIYIGQIINRKQEVKDFLTGERENKDEREWAITKKPNLRIIEDDVFNKAQELLKDRCKTFNITKKRESNKHLFSTLIKCKHCGYSFRRLERIYRKTYIRWVCSGRNANGVDSCPNKTAIDESDLIKAINKYLINKLKSQDKFKEKVVKRFNKIFEANSDIITDKNELEKKLKQLKRHKEKELDMYRDNLVTREELNEKVKPINTEIKKVEDQIEMIEQDISMADKAGDIVDEVFKTMENMVDISNMTNLMLKKIIEKIEVGEDGAVDVYLYMLSSVDTERTVLFCDNHT